MATDLAQQVLDETIWNIQIAILIITILSDLFKSDIPVKREKNIWKVIYIRVAEDLMPHNKITTKNMEKIFRENRKCCAIQPTGTGKSFLILWLLERLKDENKKAIIFEPRKNIESQIRKYMKKYDLDNAEFYTYHKLGRMKKQEIKELKCDAIIPDELHRTGAPTFSKGFELLVESHPDAIVFGTTATPVRPSDGKDMSELYCDGIKACNISLAEAFVRDIIKNPPLYISTLYTLENVYKEMCEKIEKSSNKDKEVLKKKLFDIKNHIENANGVSNIIRKHIPKYDGKYIVFCDGIDTLTYKICEVVNWFCEAGFNKKDIHTYEYHSKTNQNAYKQFKKTKIKGLHLLFVIDKLSEGVHIEDVNGCILLRSTKSNIIYFQQIGRVIDSGRKEKTIILDLVNNFNNMETFNLHQEIEEKIRERKEGKFEECNTDFNEEKYKYIVIDYVHDCLKMFQEINDRLFKCGEDWEKWEDDILIEKYPMQGSKIPELSHRGMRAIHARARRLGITYVLEEWSDEDTHFVIENYNKMTKKEIADTLNKTIPQVTGKANKLNLRKDNRFTNDEILFVEENAPIYGAMYCSKKLKRPLESVRRVCKRYNINALKATRDWTEEDDNIIKEKYPFIGAKVVDFLDGNITESQVTQRARKLGVSFDKELYYRNIFDSKCELIKEMQYKGITVKYNSKYNEVDIGRWVKHMKNRFNKGKLSDYEINHLKKLEIIK